MLHYVPTIMQSVSRRAPQPHDPNLAFGRLSTGLEELTEEQLRTIRASGFIAVGIVAAIMSHAVPHDPRLLMLHHKPYHSKVQAGGAWGPLAETARVHQNGSTTVESPFGTMWRAIREELGIELGFPRMHARTLGATTHYRWPVGHNSTAVAFGTVPIVHLAEPGAEDVITKAFRPTSETDDVRFMSPDEIRDMPDEALRAGTRGWLEVVMHSPLAVHEGPFVPVPPRTSHMPAGTLDAILADLDLGDA